ncbi:MAG: hypothetical protein ACOYOP_09730 [Microthrixaceae bacterium]
MPVRRQSLIVLAAAVALLAVAGCTPQPTSGVSAGPEAPVWIVGDSISTGVGFAMTDPRPYVWGVGASGFTPLAITTILGNTTARLDDTGGAPRTMLALGGLNDLAVNATIPQILTHMQEFEDAMNARGITVVWVKQPAWARAAQMTPIYEWQDTRSHVIDCLAVKGPNMFGDEDHPLSYTAFGDCVGDTLRSLPGLDLG